MVIRIYTTQIYCEDSVRSCTWKCLQPRLSWLLTWIWTTPSVQFSSVTQSCLTLCDHMDCSTPGFAVHQKLPELTQTHVHRVSDVIQPSHPLLSPSPPAFNLSHHSWPHGLQHTRLPCPSPTPGAYSKLTSIKSVMPSNHLILHRPLLLPPSIFPTIPCIAATHVKRVSQQTAKCPRPRSSIHDYQTNKYNEQKPKGVDQWLFELQELQGYDESYGLSPPMHTYSILCGISGTLQTSWSLVMVPQVDRHQYKAFSSVAQSCLTLCDPMNLSTPGTRPYWRQSHIQTRWLWSRLIQIPSLTASVSSPCTA